MFSNYIFLISIISIIHSVYSNGYYTIIGSKQIRPNSEYAVAVTLHNYPGSCTIRLSIENDNYKKTKEITVASDRTQLVNIPTDDMVSTGNDYKLIAEGIAGIIFRNETVLNLNEKKCSIFIQMDKGMYKPNDLVQFRVLVLDQLTRPIDVQSELKVYITDGKQNLIHQWSAVKPIKGVFSNKLQLSKYLVHGDWNINVEYLEEKKQKSFKVVEYVLPRFEVIIDAPKHQLYSDDIIRATITGKYTYGKLVRGELVVSINKAKSSDPPILQIVKNIDNDEKAQIEFNIADLKLSNQKKQDFQISANMTEELTGQKQSKSMIVTLHVEKYQIECISPSTHFQPDKLFEFIVKVTKYDGTPITDDENEFLITYGRTHKKRADNTISHSIQNGIVPVELFISRGLPEIHVYAVYLNKEKYLGIFYKAESSTGDYLQASIRTENLRINAPVSIEVELTNPVKKLTYLILGRGNVLQSNTINVNTKRPRFSIRATVPMLPRAQLIIFYIKKGEIIYTKLELEFTNDLFNEITVLSSAETAKPGDAVDIVVTTSRDSYVGLLGVDQSLLTLKSGFDLSRQLIFDDLNEYNVDYNRNGSTSQKTYNILNDFFDAGAVILSNAIGNISTSIGVDAIIPRIGDMNNNKNNVKIRKNFPETWIWDEISANFSGTRILKKTVPDTITSWIITGFSINSTTGLGITKMPKTIQVFQPFFVSLDLPYSIKLGETFAIKVLVFNYAPATENAQVKLFNDKQEFEFAEPIVSPDTFYTKNVEIKSNDGSAVTFLIRPNITGLLTIKVSAQISNAGDTIERMLLIKPTGIRKFPNQAIFVDLRNHQNYQTTLSVIVPPNAVPNSTKLDVTVTGDIMGASLTNLEDLIRMPSGCGEQNMLNFVPNIVILDYLTSSGQLTAAIQAKATGFMVSGYQNELNYARNDGSFSVFGKSDSVGSTWLTGYVIRSFTQAKKYIAIDSGVINRAVSWLISIQANDGSFPEIGRIWHTPMQGGSGHGIALTAYALISILEVENSQIQYKANIDKTIAYLLNAVEKNIELYDLALITYAFQLTNHPSKASIYDQFLLKAQKIDDRKWWGTPSNNVQQNINSMDIEMTSYGLLASLLAGLDTEGLSIVRWLLHNRSNRGGFESTQDTVMGITALAAYSKLTSSKGSNVEITIKHDGTDIKAFVTEANALTLQKFPLPSSSASEVSITATGNGFAIVELSNQYNIDVDEPSPSFNLTATIIDTSTVNQLLLSVCGSYIPQDGQLLSNMAIMEVELPSGFVANFDQFTNIRQTKNVKKVETKNGDTIVVIYFDNFGADKICPIISGFRQHKVANVKPVPVILYDYYDNSKKALNFYQIQPQSVLDICEQVDCRALA